MVKVDCWIISTKLRTGRFDSIHSHTRTCNSNKKYAIFNDCIQVRWLMGIISIKSRSYLPKYLLMAFYTKLTRFAHIPCIQDQVMR